MQLFVTAFRLPVAASECELLSRIDTVAFLKRIPSALAHNSALFFPSYRA